MLAEHQNKSTLQHTLLKVAEIERVNLSIKYSREDGSNIPWSNKIFKMWKKSFHTKYRLKTNSSFKVDYPDSNERARFYEYIFGIAHSGIISINPGISKIMDLTSKGIVSALEEMEDIWKRDF